MFFYIMKIAFPDSDFGKAKKDLTFPIPGNSGAATKQPIKPCSIIHGKQLGLEGDPSPPPRSAPRPWTSKANFKTYDGDRQGVWVNVSSSDGTRPRSIGICLENSAADRSLLRPLPAHPGCYFDAQLNPVQDRFNFLLNAYI
ncbi:hypothetical protein KSP40_PGU000702 [Platanthera guangdongensis]|uniref:Uncharacterized protein n=1 Tax=Platanthera guangdongensis TaxID=2320717 RepID=A0ABR2M9N2_9ASPA